jgi:NADH-quinone oxidoreductase subunit L
MAHDPAHFWNGAIASAQEHVPVQEHAGEAAASAGAHGAEEVPFLIAILPLVCGVAAIALAWLFYVRKPRLPAMVANLSPALYRFSLNKWYFDELYDRIFVRPVKALGRGLWHGGDEAIIDRFGPNGIAALTLLTTRRATRLQTGFVYHYAFAMLIGVAAFVTWYLVALRG